MSDDARMTRIGVFYDGTYFHKVSDYYNYNHARRSRLSLSGIHKFILNRVAQEESVDERFCHIVDAHYFRGRFSAQDANDKQLYHDRIFDGVLMSEGITTHYLPLKSRGGRKEEKGIDVWLALEAYELAYLKKFSIVVLVACDGDYVPLVRKLSTLGTRVMLISWDFEYQNEHNETQTTRTSQDLLEEVTYPVTMNAEIEHRVKKNDSLINNLFVAKKIVEAYSEPATAVSANAERKRGTILSIKDGFGFIKHSAYPNNLFFHPNDLVDVDFNSLHTDQAVEFSVGKTSRNEDGAKNVKLV